MLSLTVQRRIHSAQVNQQADHRHILCGLMFSQQLVPQDLARLATSSHSIDIQIRKVLEAFLRLIAVGEHLLLILKHRLEEVVLDILAPQRFAIILLQMLDLVPSINRILRASRGGLLALSRCAGSWLGRSFQSAPGSPDFLVFRHVVGDARYWRSICARVCAIQDMLQGRSWVGACR